MIKEKEIEFEDSFSGVKGAILWIIIATIVMRLIKIFSNIS